MPEFETVAAFVRKQLEKCDKPVDVGLKIRGQLKQNWSGLLAE
jgi:hypothetical protein